MYCTEVSLTIPVTAQLDLLYVGLEERELAQFCAGK